VDERNPRIMPAYWMPRPRHKRFQFIFEIVAGPCRVSPNGDERDCIFLLKGNFTSAIKVDFTINSGPSRSLMPFLFIKAAKYLGGRPWAIELVSPERRARGKYFHENESILPGFRMIRNKPDIFFCRLNPTNSPTAYPILINLTCTA